MRVIHYLTADNKDLYQDWLDGLRDLRARIAIQRRVDRLGSGYFGDHRFCRDGVWELRINIGAGYRVYYAQAGQTLVFWYCCCAAVTSVHRTQTLSAPCSAGRTINRGYHEQQTVP